MPFLKRYSAILALMLIAALPYITTSCNHATPLPDQGSISTTAISELKILCHSDSYAITQDIILDAHVTANDQSGEYAYAIVVEDQSGGIEVRINDQRLYSQFALGMELQIACNGLALGRIGGKIVLGTPTQNSDFNVSSISAEDIDRHLTIKSQQSNLRQAQHLEFNEITSRHIDTYIQLSDVSFQDPGQPWCQTDSLGAPLNTTHTILNSKGESLMLYMPSSCEYANAPTPNGIGAIYCIVDYYYSEYRLRVVNHEFIF